LIKTKIGKIFFMSSGNTPTQFLNVLKVSQQVTTGERP